MCIETTSTAAPESSPDTPKGGDGRSGEFTQHFNASSQYNADVIRAFEGTFGVGYMSAGGLETTLETADYLKPVLLNRQRQGGAKMLDVGCGIGGVAFFFAQEYGAHVHGVDVNEVGIGMAQEALAGKNMCKGSCKFEVDDITSMSFPEGSLDIIYSRDVLLHIPNDTKTTLFAKFYQWLSPGGMICIGDYCIGHKSAEVMDPVFQAYLEARDYHMLSTAGYKDMFVQAGFDKDCVTSEDRQLWYCRTSQKEIDRLSKPGPARDEFLKSHTEEVVANLEKTYRNKIEMTLRGDRSYVMVTATKHPQYYQLRKAVSDAYKKISADKLVFSCDGNVSARANADSFLITPSGVDVADVTAQKVVLCNNNGKALAGESYKPSSEYNLHSIVYRNRPDVGGIVHSHSIYACALASCRLPLPPTHYSVCELLSIFDFSSPANGSTGLTVTPEDAVVKCGDYHTYGTKELAEATYAALGQNHAALMANHGTLVTGPDLEMALYNSYRLERECEIYWRALQMGSVGPPKPLTLKEIDDLQRMDETYGQEHREEEDENEEE